MFDLPPPRHISTLRIFAVTESSGEGLLNEPATALRAIRQRGQLSRHLPLSRFSVPLMSASGARLERLGTTPVVSSRDLRVLAALTCQRHNLG
jgi:hypothetical protein